jgi:hypothetical protein
MKLRETIVRNGGLQEVAWELGKGKLKNQRRAIIVDLSCLLH